jgi:hypothetical protein
VSGEWPALQKFIRQVISKQLSELQLIIKQKILTAGFLTLEAINGFPDLKAQLIQTAYRLTILHNCYFGSDALQGMRTLTKQLSGNKDL